MGGIEVNMHEQRGLDIKMSREKIVVIDTARSLPRGCGSGISVGFTDT